MIKAVITESISKDVQKGLSQDRLQTACAEFESVLLNYMMKSIRSSIANTGFVEKGHEGGIVRSMFDETIANEVAKSGGFGLGNVLYERLKGGIG